MAMLSKVGNDNRTPPPTTGNAENLNHKNDLNCYCQKLGIPLPVYNTRVEGSAHAFRFRSTVTVGQKSFTPSSDTLATRKSAAEQDAAKLALQHLLIQELAVSSQLRLHLRKLVHQDKARCKMILNEFIAKTKMGCSYQTVQVQAVPPLFVSTVALNGTCYKGAPGKNKKEAEQLAALEAILSLLDDPAYAASISSVIKSKFNTSAVFDEAKNNPNTGDCSVTDNVCKTVTSNILVPLSQTASLVGQSSSGVVLNEENPTLQANNIEELRGSIILVNKNKQDLANLLPQIEKQSGHQVLEDKQGGAGLPTGAMDNASCSDVNPPITSPSLSKAQHEKKLPEAALSASEQINVPIEKKDGPGIVDEKQGDAGLLTEAGTSSCVNLPVSSPLFSVLQHEIKLPEAGQLASQQISVPIEKQGSHCTLGDKKGGADLGTEAVTTCYMNLQRTSPSLSELQPGIKLAKAAESDSQEHSVPIGFVPPPALSPVYDLISSKKRERNKKKANKKKENKRLRAENK